LVSESEPDGAFCFSVAAALVLAGFLLFATACGREEADPTLSAPPSLEAPTVSDVPFPEPGSAWVEFADGRVSVLSNGANRLAVLRRLAQQADFELVTRDLERRALRLRIEDAGLGDALFAMLRGVRYSLEYDFDEDVGSHVLVRLTVGEPVEIAAPEPRPAPPDGEREPQRARRGKGRERFEKLRERVSAASPEDRRRLREKHDARAEEMEAELLDQLGDGDPEVRVDAVSELPLEGEGEQGEERLERVAQVLTDDPDPRVRMAAAQRLGETDSRNAVAPLVGALSDPEREVVLEAIDALEDIDDPSVIPDLEALLQDPDPRIREAAEFAIEYLKW
jgi:hypothetical protein